jgi:serine/threonine protein kinase
MDLLLGGDLRYHIARRKKFTEDQTRFFIACLVHALDSVHAANIIHRDIKPENLVFDNQGYLRLTDFGVARFMTPDNASETSGTPGYMAPEVMCRQNHNLVSDYFAVGVIAFECMMGRRPYVGKNRREIREQILCKQI